MDGWISIHRKIMEHWVFSDAEKLKAWLTILMEVNHSTSKVLFGNEVLICSRGESLKSLDTWAKTFGRKWDKSKVRRFFKLLENEGMIALSNEIKTTRLTVCNYESYQSERNGNDTQKTLKRNGNKTETTPNNNVNNGNNLNNENKGKPSPPSFPVFKDFAIENSLKLNIELDEVKLRLKYEAWIENGWKTGKNQVIKNWKSTVLNTLVYLQKEKSSAQKEKDFEPSENQTYY